MEAGYFDKVLKQYQGTFDIYRDYEIDGECYPAYGYFSSHSEKYVLVKEVQLWEANSYEHILFIDADEVNDAVLEKADRIFKEYMEPCLVRKGEKYPAKNHMYSFLTVIIFSSSQLSGEMKKKIEKYRFEKNYMFSIRGYSSGRLGVIDIVNGEVITNPAGKVLKKLYKKIFK